MSNRMIEPLSGTPSDPETKMRHWRVVTAILILASGCASTNPMTARAERYRALAAESTPSDWKAGATWVFLTTGSRGASDTLIFRVTDVDAETCALGLWHKLELLEGNIGTESKPAAMVEGRNLVISLTSNMCDIDNEIKGELTNGDFKGERSSGSMMGSTLLGQVQGWRVK